MFAILGFRDDAASYILALQLRSRSVAMASFPLVSATGMLGSGFRAESLDKAISLGVRMIGCDAGSTDPSPGPLATDTCMFSAAAGQARHRDHDDPRHQGRYPANHRLGRHLG